MASELCMGIHVFTMSAHEMARYNDNLDSADGSSSTNKTPAIIYAFFNLSGFTARDYNFYLGEMTGFLSASKLAFPEKLEASAKVRKRIEENVVKRLYFNSGMLLPALNTSFRKEAEDLSEIRILQTVLAAERYRLAHQDQLPGQLADLAPTFLPAVPMDPFNGQPLHYKKLAKGYMVYGVGRDRKDDGGIEKPSKVTTNTPYDLTFTVER